MVARSSGEERHAVTCKLRPERGGLPPALVGVRGFMGCSESMDTMSVMPATPEPSARWSCLNPTMRAYAKVLSSRTTSRVSLTGAPAASARLYPCAIARPHHLWQQRRSGGNLGELVPAIVGKGLWAQASAQSQHLAPRSLGPSAEQAHPQAREPRSLPADTAGPS